MSERLKNGKNSYLLYLVQLQLVTPKVAQARGIGNDKPVFVPLEYPKVTFKEDGVIKAENITFSVPFDEGASVMSFNGFVAVTRVNKADIISTSFRDLYRGVRREEVRSKTARIEKILVYCKAKDPNVHNGGDSRGREIRDKGFVIQAGDELIPVCKGVHPKNPEFILPDHYRDPNRVAMFAYKFQRDPLTGKLSIEPLADIFGGINYFLKPVGRR